MHLDMTTFKSTNIHLLNSNQGYHDTYDSSVKELCLPEPYVPSTPALNNYNVVIQNEHKNRNLFSLENDNFLKQHFGRKDIAEDVAVIKVENEEEALDKTKLENFQDVFFVPPPFQPFSSPPSSVLSSLPALSPDDDVAGLNGIFSNTECDLESQLVDLNYEINTFQNDYLPDEKVRNGHILMPIHNPPVMPNMSGDVSDHEKYQQFSLPEGFNTNILHIPDNHQVDDLQSILTQMEEPNNFETTVKKYPGLPRFSKSLFTKASLTPINFQDSQPIPQKTDEFIPILNFKAEYCESESQTNVLNRIFDCEVKENLVGLTGSDNLTYDNSDSKSNFVEFYDNQEVKKKIGRRGRRKGSCSEWKDYCDRDLSYQNLELYDSVDPAPKRIGKTASGTTR